MVFETQCRGISCSVLTNYHWSLYVRLDNSSHESWREIKNLHEIASTSLDRPNFVISGDSIFQNRSNLMENRTYKIHVIAWLDHKNFQADDYIFHTNLPPLRRGSSSGCFVEPYLGQAITTEFTIECANWVDSDGPLRYQFSYQTKIGVVVFHTGWQSNVTTELPVGSKTSNYSLHLQLEVIDSLGDSSVELITVQVIFSRI